MRPQNLKVFSFFFTIVLILSFVSACAPAPVEPAPTQPAVAEPAATKSAPTEAPAPTEAAPAEPAPTEPAPAAEPAKITVWLLGNSGPGVENALPGFKAKYPDIEVDMQVFGWNDLQPKLQAALTAGSGAPDVVEVFTNNMPNFYDSGAFKTLNEEVAPYQNDIASYGFLETKDSEDNIYGLAWSVSPSLLFYRSDILEPAGVDPATLKTWDDLVEAGKKVTHDDQYMFLTASQATQPQYYNYFTGMLSQLGGSPFDVNGNNTINENDDALKVLQQMEAIDLAAISMDVDAWWTPAFEAALKSGKLGSFASGVFHVSILKTTDPDGAGKWRVQLAPTFADGEATGIFTGGGRALAITTQSQVPEAAWKFIEYMMLSQEGVQATWEGGAITPSYIPSFSGTFFDAPDPYYGDQPVGRIVIDGMKLLDGQQWFSGPIPSGVMANDIVGNELRALMTNEKTPEEALQGILDGMEANMP